MPSNFLFDTEQGFTPGQEMVVGVHTTAIAPVSNLMHSHLGLLLIAVCNTVLACREARGNSLCKKVHPFFAHSLTVLQHLTLLSQLERQKQTLTKLS